MSLQGKSKKSGFAHSFLLLLFCVFAVTALVLFSRMVPVGANGDIELKEAFIVSSVSDDTKTTDSPKTPAAGERVHLYLVLKALDKGEPVYFTEADAVSVGGKDIPAESLRRWDGDTYGRPDIRWYKVEPTDNNLSNTAGGWHWQKVPHRETQFEKGTWTVKADVNPTVFRTRTGKGTMRYKVSVNYGAYHVSSPGKESYGKTGINGDVHRISVRGATGVPIVDWGYSFMNLPYIWGSESPTGKPRDHQSERYIGADCADYVVAAARRAGFDLKYGGSHNLSPQDSRKYTKYVSKSPELRRDGYYYSGGKKVTVGKGGVRPGDIVLFTKRHVGILARDLPPMGYLSADDTILHAFFKEPAEEPISTAYHSGFSIVRLVK
jgi:hypothetical protein